MSEKYAYLLFGSMDRARLISSSAFSRSDVRIYACDLLNRALTLYGSSSKTCCQVNLTSLEYVQPIVSAEMYEEERTE